VMDIHSNPPEYEDWMRRDADGKPMITSHMGWTRFYEGCLNSPLRDQSRERVRAVVTNYPADLMSFDGPDEGTEKGGRCLHCHYCLAAYRQVRGKDIPPQDSTTTLEDEIGYHKAKATKSCGWTSPDAPPNPTSPGHFRESRNPAAFRANVNPRSRRVTTI
jgi:hypothetical protein